MVKINGQEENVANESLKDYLEENGYNKGRIAVECNGEIVPRSEYENKILADGDILEIVRFVAGG